MIEPGLVAVGIAVLAALPPTIIALATLQTSRSNAKKSDALIVKADEIHDLTNSNLQDVKADLKAANEKIDRLEKLISDARPPQKRHNRVDPK